MNEFELNKSGNRWVPSYFFCPACNGPLMAIEPRKEIEKSGIAFLECFRCKGKVIYEIEGDTPDHRFLPRDWTPKFKPDLPVIENGNLSTLDCPLIKCKGELKPIQNRTWECTDCSGILSTRQDGFQFMSKTEYMAGAA